MTGSSKLISFLDKKKQFSMHLFQGTSFIEEVLQIHEVDEEGLKFFLNAILSIAPLTVLLKHNEQLGLFIDSEDPKFMLKFELSSSGHTRCMILPGKLSHYPEKISGIARISKITPKSKQPYTSVLQIEELNFEEVINQFLLNSYQFNAHIVKSIASSLLILQLPNEEGTPAPKTELFFSENQDFFADLLKSSSEEEVKKTLAASEFDYTQSTEIKHHCQCSKARMFDSIITLVSSSSIDEIFEKDQFIETKCDYCKTTYQIKKKDIEEALSSLH